MILAYGDSAFNTIEYQVSVLQLARRGHDDSGLVDAIMPWWLTTATSQNDAADSLQR